MTSTIKTNNFLPHLSKKKLFFIAGEASGDIHTANLIKQIKIMYPEMQIHGFGGEKMREAGCQIHFELTKLAALGLIEVIKKYPQFKKAFHYAINKLKEIKPDAIVFTDFPGFNLRLAKQAKLLGIPTIFYVSPQVWAWKRHRVHTIPKIIDLMLVIFPFEKSLYTSPNMEVKFVGHPLLEHIPLHLSPQAAKKSLELPLNNHEKIITLVPGSRKHELNKIFPIMIQTANFLNEKMDNIQFLITQADFLPESEYNHHLKDAHFNYRLIKNKTHEALIAADFSIVKSGTSTLEATLLEAPYIIVYKVSFFTYLAAKHLVKIPFIGIANIIAGKMIVPEFLQQWAKPKVMANYIEQILKYPQKRNQLKYDLQSVKKSLQFSSPSLEAAISILNFINKDTPI